MKKALAILAVLAAFGVATMAAPLPNANLPHGMTLELRGIGERHYFVVMDAAYQMIAVKEVDLTFPTRSGERRYIPASEPDVKHDHETTVTITDTEIIIRTVTSIWVNGVLVEQRVTEIRLPRPDREKED